MMSSWQFLWQFLYSSPCMSPFISAYSLTRDIQYVVHRIVKFLLDVTLLFLSDANRF